MLPALLPFVFALLWASSYVAAKIGLIDATPFALVGARLAIAAVGGRAADARSRAAAGRRRSPGRCSSSAARCCTVSAWR